MPTLVRRTLYAYTEGFDDRKPRDVNHDALGPLWVSVRFGDTSFDFKRKHRFIPRWEWEIGDKQPRLFCRIVMADKIGEYRIAVRKENGKEIAQSTVRVTNADFHPWSPLLLTANEVYERIGDGFKYQRVSPAKATYDGRGIALPNFVPYTGNSADGWNPAMQRMRRNSGDKSVNAPISFGKGTLPSLVPQEVGLDAKVKFSEEKQMLIIEVTPKIRLPRPDTAFLCRWWVNGKPFVPEQVDPIPEIEGGTTYYPNDEKEVQIELKINAKNMNAKSGDTIDLQLLHCPQGWLAVENPFRQQLGGKPGYPSLSNRVRFKLQ